MRADGEAAARAKWFLDLGIDPEDTVAVMRVLVEITPRTTYYPTTTIPSERDGVNLRSRRLLLTTNSELKAIAAPAIIGFRRPAAASGSAATL